VKRKATTKAKNTVEDFEEYFLFDIKVVVALEEINNELRSD